MVLLLEVPSTCRVKARPGDDLDGTIGNAVSVEQVHARLGSRILWLLIRSWLSEVLPPHHLATLWDHFFANPMRPLMIPAAAIAFLIVHRLTLLSLPGYTDFFTWVTSSRTVPMSSLLLLMYRIDADFSSTYLPELIPDFPRPSPPPPLSLTDLGWPLWYRPGEVEHMSGVSYPELVVPPPVMRGDARELGHAWEIRREQFLREASQRLQPGKITSPIGDDTEGLVVALTALLQQEEQQRVLDELAAEERAFSATVQHPLSETATTTARLTHEIRLRETLLAFYDQCLTNIQRLKRRPPGPVPLPHRATPATPTAITALTAEHDWKLIQTLLQEDASLTLNAERIAQRRRVIEEEARALLARLQRLLPSSSSGMGADENNHLSSVSDRLLPPSEGGSHEEHLLPGPSEEEARTAEGEEEHPVVLTEPSTPISSAVPVYEQMQQYPPMEEEEPYRSASPQKAQSLPRVRFFLCIIMLLVWSVGVTSCI